MSGLTRRPRRTRTALNLEAWTPRFPKSFTIGPQSKLSELSFWARFRSPALGCRFKVWAWSLLGLVACRLWSALSLPFFFSVGSEPGRGTKQASDPKTDSDPKITLRQVSSLLDVLRLCVRSHESASVSVVYVATDQMVGDRRSPGATILGGEIVYLLRQPSPSGPPVLPDGCDVAASFLTRCRGSPNFRQCRCGDFGMVSRHKPAEHRIPDVSATPDVEALYYITRCRGSRVFFTRSSMSCGFSPPSRRGSGDIAPSCTRCGAHRLCPRTCRLLGVTVQGKQRSSPTLSRVSSFSAFQQAD